MIALACDHTGIELKKEMMKLLDSMGLEWKDFGTDTAISCDYPVYGYRAAKAVASGECDRGILICGTGIGIGIAASKVKGTRVCTCSDVYSAELSKRHNNSNILTMGARVVSRKIITDGTESQIVSPYGIAVHPTNGDIYITDAKNYTSSGTLYCYSKSGAQKWSATTGDIPGHFAFLPREK